MSSRPVLCIASLTIGLGAGRVTAQTEWTSFDSRTDHAAVHDPEFGVVAFGGQQVGAATMFDDTWIRESAGSVSQSGWVRVRPGGASPPALVGHVMGSISRSSAGGGRVVLFGGRTSGGPSSGTWVFDGNCWESTTPALDPPARERHAMASMSHFGQVLMFGGQLGATPLGDTWLWGVGGWTSVPSGVGDPAPRGGHAMAYDETRQVVLMFGGFGVLPETWEFDPSTLRWTLIQTPIQNTPLVRTETQMAYDPRTQRVILFAGRDGQGGWLNDTWVFQPGTGWVLSPPQSFSQLERRAGHVVAYDAIDRHLITHGGTDPFGNPNRVMYRWGGSSWTPLLDRAPIARWGHAACYSEASGRVVMFGGFDNNNRYTDETWERVGSEWFLRTPIVRPFARRDPAMAFLPRTVSPPSGPCVMYGGDAGGASFLSDTWEFDGAIWHAIPTSNSPGPRSQSLMTTDTLRNRVVLFGGSGGAGYLVDTWSYDGDWALITNSGPAQAYAGGAMAYDPIRDEVVLSVQGPNLTRETWVLRNGNSWVQLQPTITPSHRVRPAMCWDADRRRIVMFGGALGSNVFLADTWEWDGTNWAQRFPVPTPRARWFATLVHDPERRANVLYGGASPAIYDPDTWELRSSHQGLAIQLVDGCTGPSGTPRIEVERGYYPRIADQVRLRISPASAPAPAMLLLGARGILDLSLFGAPMCLTSVVLPAWDTRLFVNDLAALSIPNTLTLLGAQVSVQALVINSGANALGVTLSNGLLLQIGSL